MFQPTLESPVALYSPEAQERIGRQFCAASDLPDPLLYFDDDYSGTSGERPAFLRLKNDARARKLKTVIVPKMDRFARDVILCLQTYDELRAHRRALLQQLFVTVWLEKTEVTAVQPSPLFMPLLIAASNLYTTSTGVEAARRRRTPLWRGFAAPVL